MEPILRGPRFLWTCKDCSFQNSFAMDTCKSHQPFQCGACNKLDPQSNVDFNDATSIAEKTILGAQVKFESLRKIHASRTIEIAKGQAQSSGLARGDVVVFEESIGSLREIKRIVGFPMEQIAIDRGDILVDDVKWSKSLEQSLRQAILVHAWDGAALIAQAKVAEQKSGGTANRGAASRSTGGWSYGGLPFTGLLRASGGQGASMASAAELTFDSPIPPFLDNRLAVNAHDSHAIVHVKDFGFAFQPKHFQGDWGIRCRFWCEANESQVELRWSGASLAIQGEKESVNVEINPRNEKALWIIVAMIDDFLVVGDQDEEWMRIALPESEAGMQRIPPVARTVPIAIGALSGELSLDQLLVFRDIHYRGQGDSSSQTWLPSPGVVVLGDNVSMSSDSRDRWLEGLRPNAIRGVVLQQGSPMETLLRQRY